jgi:hypothetical protein
LVPLNFYQFLDSSKSKNPLHAHLLCTQGEIIALNQKTQKAIMQFPGGGPFDFSALQAALSVSV